MNISPYKKCCTAEAHNTLVKEERLTRCGYADFHWSQSGVCTSTVHGFRDNFNHTKQSTNRDNLKKVLSDEECNLLREGHVPAMQKTDYLEELYSEERE